MKANGLTLGSLIRILLLDDHHILREGLACRLRQEPDFEIVGQATSSDEANACLGQLKPDLVIMNFHPPGDHDLMVVRRLRIEHPELKIVILAGFSSAPPARAVLSAGAQGLVTTAQDSQDLVRAVREVMAGHTYLHYAARPPSGEGAALNPSELAALKGLAEGLSYKEIADQLHVSVKSVEYYRTGIVKKTGCTNRAELVRYAVRTGIVAP